MEVRIASRPLASVLLLTAAAALLPAAAAAQRGSLGPMGAEEGGPLQRLGYTPMVERTGPVAPGELRTDLWLGYTNLFEQDSTASHELYLDMERLVTAITVRYGLAPRVEVGGRISLHTAWGGWLDGFMVDIHRAFGQGVRNRPFFPDGDYGAYLRDGEGRTLVDLPERRLALDDVRLFAKWAVAGGPEARGTLAARAVARIPVAAPTVGSERTDLGLMLLGSVAWRGVFVHAMAGGSTVRRGPDMRGVLRGAQGFGMLGIERPFRERLSGVIELTGSTQLLRDFQDHDVSGMPTNMIFGVVGVTGGGWRWEAGIQEDIPPRGPSLDFTLQFALSRSW